MRINIIDLKFFKDNFDNLKINTPDGFQDIGELYNKPQKECYSVSFSNGDIIECSLDHMFQLKDKSWKKTKDLKENDITLDGFRVLCIIPIGIHDTYDLEVLHDNHRYYSDGIVSHNSGKTLVALACAMRLIDVNKDKYDKIVYIRKTVVSDSEELGFLKGDLDEKMAGFLAPLYSNLEFIVEKKYANRKSKLTQEELEGKVEDIKNKYQIQFKYEGHLRGSNIRNAIILWDECLSKDEIVYTQIGPMKIEDVYNYDGDISLQSYNLDSKKVELKPMNSLKRKHISTTNEKMYKITTEEGEEIKVTGNHKLLVNGKYEKVENIKVGDVLYGNR